MVLLLCHSLWQSVQQRKAIARWLEERGEVALRMTKNKGFGMLTYDVDARRTDGSENRYGLGIDQAFLTGRVREVVEMERDYLFGDKTIRGQPGQQ